MNKFFALVLVSLSVFLFGAACGEGSDDEGDSQAQQEVDPRAGWPSTFKIGLFGGDDAEETLRNAAPVKKLMEEQLGMPVEIFTGTSYSAVIEAMRAGRVDAMTVGPFAYILAVQEAKAEAIAVGISTTAKEPVYDSTILPY